MDSSIHNGMIGCGSNQSSETPPLCARGCGFFGAAENLGLCSKCYTDYLKETMSKSEAALIIRRDQVAVLPSHQSKINVPKEPEIVSTPVVAKKKRCGLCNKKLGLLGFECRCGGTFCGMHRYPEAHPCKFDFKNAGKIIIETENPVCRADKITDRV